MHGLMVSYPPTRTRLNVLPFPVLCERRAFEHSLERLGRLLRHLDLAPEPEQLVGHLGVEGCIDALRGLEKIITPIEDAEEFFKNDVLARTPGPVEEQSGLHLLATTHHLDEIV